MQGHIHRTPLPAAVPPAARGLSGPMARARLREALADRIERYLTIMDALDGDPDLEEGADGEPSLCGVGTHVGGSWTLMPGGCGDDREPETEHDEPSLGSLGGCGVSSELIPQTQWAGGARDDREHDEADGPEGDDERELDHAEHGIADAGGVAEQLGATYGMGYAL